MYLRHFGLQEAPFSITPDSSFFYPHEGVQAAYNTVLVALRSGEGFLKIVGEVGCGKTVLCRQLLKTLQDECVTAYIPNPDMGPDDLLLALLDELRVGLEDANAAALARPGGRHAWLAALNHALIPHAKAGRRVVVFIDEAQAMPLQTIESLRLLSNLETEKHKLLQLVLLGQPELDVRLAAPEIRQLLQRITFSEYLGPLTADQVQHYLTHRLAVAALSDATDLQVFEPRAVQALAQASRGVPRLLNVLANKCLMLAYGENSHRVTVSHVQLASTDTPGVQQRRHDWAPALWRRLFRRGRTA